MYFATKFQSTAETIKGFRVRFKAFNYAMTIAQNNGVEQSAPYFIVFSK